MLDDESKRDSDVEMSDDDLDLDDDEVSELSMNSSKPDAPSTSSEQRRADEAKKRAEHKEAVREAQQKRMEEAAKKLAELKQKKQKEADEAAAKRLKEKQLAEAKAQERLAKKQEEQRLAKQKEEQRLAKQQEEQRLAKQQQEQQLAKQQEEQRLAKQQEEQQLAKQQEEQRLATEHQNRVAEAHFAAEKRAAESAALKKRLEELRQEKVVKIPPKGAKAKIKHSPKRTTKRGMEPVAISGGAPSPHRSSPSPMNRSGPFFSGASKPSPSAPTHSPMSRSVPTSTPEKVMGDGDKRSADSDEEYQKEQSPMKYRMGDFDEDEPEKPPEKPSFIHTMCEAATAGLGAAAAGLNAIGKLEEDQSDSDYIQARAATGTTLPIELGGSFEEGVVFDNDNDELNSKSGLLLGEDKPWAFAAGTPKGNDVDAEKMPPPTATKQKGKGNDEKMPMAKMPANVIEKMPSLRRRKKKDPLADESSLITVSSGYSTRSKSKKR